MHIYLVKIHRYRPNVTLYNTVTNPIFNQGFTFLYQLGHAGRYIGGKGLEKNFACAPTQRI